MNSEDKRKSPRFESPNLLQYTCYDENMNKITQGMGRTVNISEGGILLETHMPMDTKHTVWFTIALEDDLMDFTGKIVYCEKKEEAAYEFGIEFLEMDDKKRLFLKQYLVIFREAEKTE